jgi:two-component system, OmpR family, sensor kinase
VTRARVVALAAAIGPGLVAVGVGAALEAGLAEAQGWPLVEVRVRAGLGSLLVACGLTWVSVCGVVWMLRTLAVRIAEHAAGEVRLAQTEARLRFMRRLDHELKNPLTAMQVALANLAEADSTGALLEGSFGTMRRQIERLGTLITDLRKLAELEGRDVEREAVGAEDVLDEVVELARAAHTVDARRIALHIERVPWSPPPIIGDRDLLVLALYNLIDNALKFSGAGAIVEVRARDDGAGTTIEVADTGTGIPDADLPHVTEELYRGQSARGTEGSGLGLALAQRVAALHGGALTIRSRPGRGTVVAIQLPHRRA